MTELSVVEEARQRAELLAAATPRPWWPSYVVASGDTTVRSEIGNRPVARASVADHEGLFDNPGAATTADARLIVAAVNEYESLHKALSVAVRRVETLEAENARLTGALEVVLARYHERALLTEQERAMLPFEMKEVALKALAAASVSVREEHA